MKRLVEFFIHLCLIIGMIPALSSAQPTGDFRDVEQILGVTGQIQEGAFVVSFPRSDIRVTIYGEAVPTAFGFGSWTAWKNMGNEAMVMGDLVLLEKEINPVISALADANINITALHNHFLGEKPRVMYMHIHGVGEAKALANGIRKALDKTRYPAVTSRTNQCYPGSWYKTNRAHHWTSRSCEWWHIQDHSWSPRRKNTWNRTHFQPGTKLLGRICWHQ